MPGYHTRTRPCTHYPPPRYPTMYPYPPPWHHMAPPCTRLSVPEVSARLLIFYTCPQNCHAVLAIDLANDSSSPTTSPSTSPTIPGPQPRTLQGPVTGPAEEGPPPWRGGPRAACCPVEGPPSARTSQTETGKVPFRARLR